MNSSFTTTQIIAKEGWRVCGIAFALFLLAVWTHFAAFFMLMVLLFLLFIYRNPERIAVEDDPLAVIAPIDGKITAINRCADELMDGKKSLYIKIRSLPLNVSMVRSPTAAVLSSAKTIYGLFLPPYTKEALTLNERVNIKCIKGDDNFAMRLRAGIFSRKLYLSKERGNIRAGTRIAFMVDGTVELFLPLETRIKLSIGDYVKGGESIMGYFAYKD
ncbi:MAG: phosphatidylserine decarboxylase [Campylobacteraceae bacterium]|jgi:phosphatidylserine decarboxylase|nr:phosphatidylserine decarboxylase [Campylobacteraceae bacterium]